MTYDERALLLAVARWVAEQEDKAAERLGTTSNLSDEIRRLVEIVRPQGPTPG